MSKLRTWFFALLYLLRKYYCRTGESSSHENDSCEDFASREQLVTLLDGAISASYIPKLCGYVNLRSEVR